MDARNRRPCCFWHSPSYSPRIFCTALPPSHFAFYFTHDSLLVARPRFSTSVCEHRSRPSFHAQCHGKFPGSFDPNSFVTYLFTLLLIRELILYLLTKRQQQYTNLLFSFIIFIIIYLFL